jgi:DNA topoisomerase VI subunit B
VCVCVSRRHTRILTFPSTSPFSLPTAELGRGFDSDKDIHDLKKKQVHQLTQLLREAKFAPPNGKCLSPAGEYNLRLGIIKEIDPDFVATHSEPCKVFDGHPFIVQAGVSLGGKDAKPGVHVYRFANRIPLLFEAGNDVASVVCSKKVRWSSYKMNHKQDKIGVFVSIVSTKIPFKGTSKEYIGNDNGVMSDTIKKAITRCCIQIKSKIAKRETIKRQRDRKRNMTKYVPDVTRAIMAVLGAIADPKGDAAEIGPFCKRRKLARDDDDDTKMELNTFEHLADRIIEQVSSQEVTESKLAEKLKKHIEQVDAELALEHVTSIGRNAQTKDLLYVVPADASRFTHRISAPCFHFSPLHP